MLELQQVSKCFANGFSVLDAIELAIAPGERIGLIGTSGCGKSTLLRIIAGLEQPTTGQVRIDHGVISAPHPKVGIVFQEPRLMPWLTVAENIRFGLRDRPIEEQLWYTSVLLERVGLTAFAKALPRQLSGGMAQRVAIARAWVTQPEILLLDEPFSALDAFNRMKLQDHLVDLWREDRPTTLLVTHDVEEALVLSDRILVLRGHPGRIQTEFAIDLPHPRRRTDILLQQWKERLLDALDLAPEEASLAAVTT